MPIKILYYWYEAGMCTEGVGVHTEEILSQALRQVLLKIERLPQVNGF